MQIDSFAPEFDATEVHCIAINASRQTVFQTLKTADLGRSPVVKLLLLLRSMPGFITRRGNSAPRNKETTLQTLIDSGFGLLTESPSEEIVLGVTAGSGDRPVISQPSAIRFRSSSAAGMARGVWNFHSAKASTVRQFSRPRHGLSVATPEAGKSFWPTGSWSGLLAV
jgi:hypothetical protein